jgi:hypothetical protein
LGFIRPETLITESSSIASPCFGEVREPKGRVMDDTTFPLMTRRQFVEFVQRQTGIPLTYSRLMKDGAIGRAPRPTAIFGKRYLYSEADALSYAKALIRSTEAVEAAR